jgi:hypothetical protein
MNSRLLAPLVAVVFLAPATPAPTPGAPPSAGAAQPSNDQPPADVKSDKLVRCLIDTPDGCDGCDKGSSCVYKQMKEYDCVYIVYGTKCE